MGTPAVCTRFEHPRNLDYQREFLFDTRPKAALNVVIDVSCDSSCSVGSGSISFDSGLTSTICGSGTGA
jgi:hypothetical protein